MSFDVAQLGISAPLLALITAGVLLLLLEAFAGGTARGSAPNRSYLMPLTLAACGVGFALELMAWSAADGPPKVIFGGMITVDKLSIFVDCLFLAAAALTEMIAE